MGKPTSYSNQVSDEGKFIIFRSDSRTTAWGEGNTAYKKENVAPTVKLGGDRVVLWESMPTDCHRWRHGQKSLSRYLKKYDIVHILLHPPKFLDLNPIAYLWDGLDRRLKKRRISNKSEVQHALME